MKEKYSRVLLALEALVFCLPITALFLLKGIPSTLYFLGEEIFEPTYITVCINVAIIIGIISAWRLMLGFVFHGRSALMNASVIWWLITGAIAICAIFAWAYANTAEAYGPSSFLSFGWGIFFIPPYVHLLLERKRGEALTIQRSPTR